MHRSRSKKLQQLRVRKDDLKALWGLLQKHHQVDHAQARAKSQPNTYASIPSPPKISVSSTGSMSTEDDSGAIFLNDVIDRQKTSSISFRYSTHEPNKSIYVQLSEGASELFNSFSVSGDDTAWVDATYTELERLLEAVPPQDSFYRKYRSWATTAMAVSIGWTFSLAAGAFATPSTGPSPQWVLYLRDNPLLNYAVRFAVFYIVGIVWAAMISSWVASLWPSIEFDFGPEHFKSEKSKRARLGVVLAVVIAPFLITLFQRVALGWK